MQGQLLKQLTMDNGTLATPNSHLAIDVSLFAKGIYNLEIRNAEKIKQYKIIKE